MAARSFQRGWPIICVEHQWVYEDTGEPISIERPCLSCKQAPTPEGYDACIGHVSGAISVCCGHGIESPYAIISEAPPCSAIQFSHRPDYFDRVADGFDRIADGFAVVMGGFGFGIGWFYVAILIIFGWPFALLSWLLNWLRK